MVTETLNADLPIATTMQGMCVNALITVVITRAPSVWKGRWMGTEVVQYPLRKFEVQSHCAPVGHRDATPVVPHIGADSEQGGPNGLHVAVEQEPEGLVYVPQTRHRPENAFVARRVRSRQLGIPVVEERIRWAGTAGVPECCIYVSLLCALCPDTALTLWPP